MRRGGDAGGVAGSSAIEAVSSWARAERMVGTLDAMSLPLGRLDERGRVRLPITVDHSLMGRSWDMRMTGSSRLSFRRSRSSATYCCWRALLIWRWMSRVEVVA